MCVDDDVFGVDVVLKVRACRVFDRLMFVRYGFESCRYVLYFDNDFFDDVNDVGLFGL